jgi:two-component system, NarL family, sensor histidine kinase UhpB
MQLSDVIGSIAQHAPNALLLVEARGTIVFANARAHALLGYPEEQLVGCSVDELVPAGRAHAHRRLREQFTGSPATRQLSGLRDLEARHRDGHLIPVEIFLGRLDLATTSYTVATLVDLSPRKQMEAELRASEAHLRTIIETEPDGVGVIGSDDAVVEMNAAGLAMLEVETVAELNEHGLASFIRPDHRQALRVLWERVTGTRHAEAELEIVGRKGTRRWLQIHAAPLRDQTGTVTALLGIARDVTGQKRLERELLEAASREQRRLSEEMHDGLGQELTGLSLLVTALAASSRAGRAPGTEALERLVAVSAQAMKTCRAIARGLSPLSDAHGGLIQALRDMANLQRDSYGADVQLEVIEGARLGLSADVLDHLYRIAQEAVTNARKHAHAKTIRMTLSILADAISLEVADDGVGIEVTTQGASGLGLRNMRHRALLIGAELTVGPRPGGGTRVACQLFQST